MDTCMILLLTITVLTLAIFGIFTYINILIKKHNMI